MLAAVGRELLLARGSLLAGALASSSGSSSSRSTTAAIAAAALVPCITRLSQTFPASSRTSSPHELATTTANEASTSYAASSTTPLTSTPSASFTQRRSYQKHFINRPNLAQPIDTNTLDALLKQTTTPGAAALHVLKYSAYLNPRQTAYMLQKLPRLEQLHRLRYNCGWDKEQNKAYRLLMLCLQQRLATVLEDCTPGQVEQGLWGLTTASLRSNGVGQHLRPGTSGVASSLDLWLQANAALAQSRPRVLSYAAWFLAAADRGQHPAMDTAVALLASPPPQGAGAGGAALKAEVGAGLDHRSLCRLAWAFSRSGRGPDDGPEQKAAWSRVCGEATAAINGMLQKHGGKKARLLPNRLYIYPTVRGQRVQPRPLPYRPSKYKRFNGPRVVTASFDLSTAISLLVSVSAVQLRDRRCLRALERLVVAMLPLDAAAGAAAPAPAHADGVLRASALLPGTPGGLIPGPSGTLVPLDPLAALGLRLVSEPGAGLASRPAGSVAAGTARLKIGASPEVQGLGKEAAGHLLRSFYDLNYRSPAVAAAVLRHTCYSQFSDEDAWQLAALAHMAVALGLRSGRGRRGRVAERLTARLLAAAAPLLPQMSAEDTAVLDTALVRAGLERGLAALESGGGASIAAVERA